MRLALLACVALACQRQGLSELPEEDASVGDRGVLDTGLPAGGPLIGEVTIGTWNLEQFPKTATTAHLVGEILASLSPDLIGLQEIADPADFTRFAEELPEYSGALVENTRSFIRVGLLYRHDRVRLENVTELFQNDGYAFPRPPLKADVTVSSTSGALFDFVFVVVHHKAQVDVMSRERRRAANVAIDSWIREQMTLSEERDFVVVGDFNDRLEDRPGENVFEVFLDQPELYVFLTLPLAQQGVTSYIPFPGLIDHLLITTDALGEYGDGTTEVLRLDQAIPAYLALISDHRPVLARFKVR